MNERKYQSLVSRLELEAHHHPRRFRATVILLSLAAYLSVFLLLAASLALGVWLALSAWASHSPTTLLGLAGWAATLAPLLFLILRKLLMRLPPPEGRPITAAEAPRLFELIDKLRHRLRAPPLHQVLVDDDFNAAIAQCPRFGLFGGHRNYLILGLPYLHAMSPQELLAVLAHECGHLAGSHGKLSAWIYRQRGTFAALHHHAESRREQDVVNGLFFALLDAIAPYYNAYTFVLSRQDEYEADQVASRLAGVDANALGLLRSALLGGWLYEEFWPRYHAQAREQPTPGQLPYSAMRQAFAAARPEWATPERLKKAWAVDSDLHDTHPCLRDRLMALDRHRELPPPVARSAAETLLGGVAAVLSKEFDEAWWREHKWEWQDRHRRHRRTSELEKLPLGGLEDAEVQEFALLLLEFRTPARAKPVLRHLLDRPKGPYPKAMFLLGRILLDEGDSRGLEYLEDACRASPSLAGDCLRTGYGWLFEKDGGIAAETWAGRVENKLRGGR